MVAAFAACLQGCGKQSDAAGGAADARTAPQQPFTPSFECLPDCFRKALESCQPTGTCVGQGTPMGRPGVNGSLEAWFCFENGVRTHVNARTMGGETIDQIEMAQDGVPCRSIESRAGPAGLVSTVRNPAGAVVATVTITSFPEMTVSCDLTDRVIDRQTDCGRTALGLVSGLGLQTPDSCKLGACK
jgi:hypothetical protein